MLNNDRYTQAPPDDTRRTVKRIGVVKIHDWPIRATARFADEWLHDPVDGTDDDHRRTVLAVYPEWHEFARSRFATRLSRIVGADDALYQQLIDAFDEASNAATEADDMLDTLSVFAPWRGGAS